MTTRVERLLTTARITLADPHKQRWDDATLIAILDEAQRDFCQQTHVLTDVQDVPILIGNPYFDLPDNCWLITRVLYDNKPLPLVTHQELDVGTSVSRQSSVDWIFSSSSWEVDTGTPQAIIYDRRNLERGKIYPIPDRAQNEMNYQNVGTVSETFFETTDYGVTTTTPDDVELLSDYGVMASLASLEEGTELVEIYGVTTAITIADATDLSDEKLGIVVAIEDYTFNSPYGVMIDMTDPDTADVWTPDRLGTVGDVSEATSHFKLYYVKNPTVVETVDSTVEVPEMYDIALKFYIVGQALMNDIDTAWQQKGAQQMAIYDRHVKNAKRDSSREFTRAGQFQTTYRTGV